MSRIITTALVIMALAVQAAARIRPEVRSFHFSDECSGYVTAAGCNDSVGRNCVWCQENDTEGICKPDLSLNSADAKRTRHYGGYHRGSCCGVAKTKNACSANTIGGDECVWFSTNVIATTDVDVNIVNPDGRDFCSKLICKIIADSNDCAPERGCEWDATNSRCDEINCRSFDLEHDCKGAGETCIWNTNPRFGHGRCVHAP